MSDVSLFAPELLTSTGIDIIETELRGIAALKDRIGSDFVKACHLALECQGRVIVVGMGKSGHIGKKIAATLASTGTPAFFVHPGEASHGDLGMITPQDVVIALSNSGNTDEVLTILPVIKRIGARLISITGNPTSALAKAADVNLDAGVNEEACPLNLAPSASTTAALVMGDALALTLLKARGFTPEDFALSHPSGTLGRRLLLRVQDIMHSGDATPKVDANASLREAIVEMTQKGLGMTAVVDEHNRALGVFTDGDLRRTLDINVDIRNTPICDVMTQNGKSTTPETLVAEALNVMETFKINGLLVLDDDKTLIGALNMHDLLRAGVV